MRRAVIRVGRLFDASQEIPEGITVFQRGCMRPLPGHGIPLVIDHDLSRQVGVVDELVEWDGEWLAARARVSVVDGWPYVGSGASWGYRTLQRQQVGGGERILEALVEEVTLCVEMTPVNVGARVELLREIAPPAAETLGENAWLDRLLDEGWTFEDAIDHVRRECGYSDFYLDQRRGRIAA